MYNFEKNLNNFVLAEAYNFKNGEEVINAIENKQVGVKINPKFSDPNVLKPLLCRDFNEFFSRCKAKQIQDTTYGIQFLLSHTDPATLSLAVKDDAIYEFLKSYKKPWVKELNTYTVFMNNQYNKIYWHEFEKQVQEESQNHGKKSKGSGNIKDADILYSDNTWWLAVPKSFDGEKAIAFYGKKGEKQTPTGWCTRCDIGYYNHYTFNGKRPLYVIRNWATGKSYQLAFMDDSVEFLDQDDVKGDEITMGDLQKLPDNLLKLVKDTKGRTLLDFKNAPTVSDPKKEKDKRYTSSPMHDSVSEAKYGSEVDVGCGLVRQKILNFSEACSQKNPLSKFFNIENGEYTTNIKEKTFVRIDKAYKYTVKDKPDIWFIYTASDKSGVDGSLSISSKAFNDMRWEERAKWEKCAEDDFGKTKHFDKLIQKRDLESYLHALESKISSRLNTEEFWKTITNNTKDILKSAGWVKVSRTNRVGLWLKPDPKDEETGAWDAPDTLVKRFTFMPMSIQVKKDDDTYSYITFTKNGSPVTFNKASGAYYDYKNEEYREKLSPEEFIAAKKVAMAMVKEIMKMSEWKELHQRYNENRDHKTSPLYENYFNY